MNRAKRTSIWMEPFLPFRRWGVIMVVLGCRVLTSTSHAGLTFQFDYSYDTEGFFDDPMRRGALETAANLVNRYTDRLAAVEMRDGDTYVEFFQPPNGPELELLEAIEVPEDTVIVYVAGRPQLGARLSSILNYHGIAEGSPEFVDAVNYRSQAGAGLTPATDYGPLFSGVSFNSDSEQFDWHFDLSTESIDPEEFDFVTVAMHALSTVLGFVTSPAYRDQTNGLEQFVGTEAVAVGSRSNPELRLDNGWWSNETDSLWNGSPQKALMRQSIEPGRRTFLTELDRAVLRDIGWDEAMPGDANLDRVFNSSDFVTMFTAGKYETETLAGWTDGDFDGDSRFGSGDLVAAFRSGQYEEPAGIFSVPEPCGYLQLGWLILTAFIGRKRYVRFLLSRC